MREPEKETSTRETRREIDKHVGDQLRIVRNLRGFSQNSLGELIGVTFQQIQKYESGRDRIASHSDIVVIPTSVGLDDLEPTIKLAHELKQKGVNQKKIAIAFCRVGDSEAEIEEATGYINQTGYFLLNGTIPARTAYRRASDTGRALTQTPFVSLNKNPRCKQRGIKGKARNRRKRRGIKPKLRNKRAGKLTQSVVDRITHLAIMEFNDCYSRVARKPRVHFLVKSAQDSPKEE